MLFTILFQFVLLHPLVNYLVGMSCALLFLVVPIVNYIRMLFAIRRHNRQLGDAVASQQMSAVSYQREKKVALDMCIVAIFLLVSVTPSLSLKIIEIHYPRVHSIVFPWSLTMTFIPSSINPLIYFGRNRNLRNALKSMMCI